MTTDAAAVAAAVNHPPAGPGHHRRGVPDPAPAAWARGPHRAPAATPPADAEAPTEPRLSGCPPVESPPARPQPETLEEAQQQLKELMSRIEADWAPKPTRPDSDEDLVRAYVEGNEHAFDKLVHRHRERLARWAESHARGQEDAEEIVQEALLNASRFLDGFRFEAKVTTWLYRLVHNSARNYYRNKEIITESYDALDSAAEIFMRGWGHDPFEHFAEHFDVMCGLQHVPEEVLTVLFATDILGHSLRESSRMLDMGRKRLTRLRNVGRDAFRTAQATAPAVQCRRRGMNPADEGCTGQPPGNTSG
ncbi:sigma-70 family RNA polymerase sigma factor [Corynebacterium sp. 13CS0277]|uniref:sigma-70 family RNA polymerase sigma factor n=1 Tax=Corynebacterium sp. 13CS0277 TaxID=2071994 RepID=UPI0013049BB8|nr:sigma-70 family RNA polymerase sigma factor [Corynebacterium sp. 13CS0277]